ncbi:hypothetical protein ONO23_01288 [Micromonospora noduli]|nr:hypothetical protein ONO23_01288 [Micromonospora noduli]
MRLYTWRATDTTASEAPLVERGLTPRAVTEAIVGMRRDITGRRPPAANAGRGVAEARWRRGGSQGRRAAMRSTLIGGAAHPPRRTSTKVGGNSSDGAVRRHRAHASCRPVNLNHPRGRASGRLRILPRPDYVPGVVPVDKVEDQERAARRATTRPAAYRRLAADGVRRPAARCSGPSLGTPTWRPFSRLLPCNLDPMLRNSRRILVDPIAVNVADAAPGDRSSRGGFVGDEVWARQVSNLRPPPLVSSMNSCTAESASGRSAGHRGPISTYEPCRTSVNETMDETASSAPAGSGSCPSRQEPAPRLRREVTLRAVSGS